MVLITTPLKTPSTKGVYVEYNLPELGITDMYDSTSLVIGAKIRHKTNNCWYHCNTMNIPISNLDDVPSVISIDDRIRVMTPNNCTDAFIDTDLHVLVMYTSTNK